MPHHPPLKSTPHLFCGTTQQGPVATGPAHISAQPYRQTRATQNRRTPGGLPHRRP